MERLVTDCSGEYPAAGYTPITLARITPLVSTPSVYATSDEVLHPRPWLLPRLPDAHVPPAAKPLVYILDLIAHVGIIEVLHPPLQIVPQGGLALLIAHAVLPSGQALRGVLRGFEFHFGRRRVRETSPIKSIIFHTYTSLIYATRSE